MPVGSCARVSAGLRPTIRTPGQLSSAPRPCCRLPAARFQVEAVRFGGRLAPGYAGEAPTTGAGKRAAKHRPARIAADRRRRPSPGSPPVGDWPVTYRLTSRRHATTAAGSGGRWWAIWHARHQVTRFCSRLSLGLPLTWWTSSRPAAPAAGPLAPPMVALDDRAAQRLPRARFQPSAPIAPRSQTRIAQNAPSKPSAPPSFLVLAVPTRIRRASQGPCLSTETATSGATGQRSGLR